METSISQPEVEKNLVCSPKCKIHYGVETVNDSPIFFLSFVVISTKAVSSHHIGRSFSRYYNLNVAGSVEVF